MAKFTREEVEETAHNLEQEDLAGVDLQGADLSGAKYNKSTKFPEGFDPEEAGMVLVE